MTERHSVPHEDAQLHALRRALLDWYAEHGSELPWRGRRDPYAVLVSEFMLQQTQRERVIPKFVAFMEEFPTLQRLAQATPAAVIRAWAGLGYNSRALRLHQIARIAVAQSGELPRDPADLATLPGVGPYTAGAVACFGFGRPAAFVDTNIRRLLRRAIDGDPFPQASPKRDYELASAALPLDRAEEWNSALMDLGARICKAARPRCEACPIAGHCAAAELFMDGVARVRGRVAEREPGHRATGGTRPPAVPFQSTDRFLRGRIIDVLRRLPDGSSVTLPELAELATGMGLPGQDKRVLVLTRRLVSEGMVAESDATSGELRYRLPE